MRIVSWISSLAVVFAASAARTGEATSSGTAAKAPAPAEAAFERLKMLAGDWVDMTGSSAGKGKLAARYRVTSAGSAVMETLFPDTSHEMISMYTREGDTIVMAHYCAMGNQPRMRARPADGDTLRFDFDGGSNLDPAKDGHMHEGFLRFVDKDKLEAEWQSYASGKPAEHRAVFELARKR